jgi:hypothetical protein
MNYEVDPYHPRYASTEFLTYEAREKRRRQRGLIGGILLAVSVVGFIVLMRSL